MALKNAYKNKLMGARTTPLSSSTKIDDTDPLAPTDNNGERDKYNLGIASFDKEKTNQNIYDAYNAYQNSPLNLGNLWNTMVNNVKQNAVNSVAEKNNAAANEATNPKWQDIQSMIDMKTANPKAELQTAMQRAQSASNEYLKALGLAGSGMGQSQLSDIGVQYQNALSKINQTAKDEVNAQLNSDFERAVSNGRYSARDVQNYINQYGEQTGLGEAWQNIAEENGATYEQEADRVFKELDNIINLDDYTLPNQNNVTVTEEQKLYAADLRDELTEAFRKGDQKGFYDLLDKNNEFLNTLNLPKKSASSEESNESNNSNVTPNESNDSNVIPEKYRQVSAKYATNYAYKQQNATLWSKVDGKDIYFRINPAGRYGEYTYTVIVNGKKTEMDERKFNKLMREQY